MNVCRSGMGIAGALLAIAPAHAVVTPAPPTPEEGDKISLYVADQETYDNNLYRVNSTFGPVVSAISPNATRADSFNTVTAGGFGQWNAGRQTFEAAARIDSNRFNHNDSLNNVSGNANGYWDYSVGPYVTGRVGAEYDRGLASFAETRFLGKDVVAATNYFGLIRYQVGPRWAVIGEFRTLDTVHSAEAAAFNNFRSKLAIGGFEYATSADNSVSIVYKYFDAKYPQSTVINGNIINSDYKEYFPQFLWKYTISDKSRFSGNIGHQVHQYTTEATGRFTGIIWRLLFDYQATDKVDLVARSWREIHAYTVSEADYFVSKGGSLSPVYNITDKVALSVVLSYEDQNYIVNSTSAALYGVREDKVYSAQANVQYVPRPKWLLNLFVRHENRSSNQAGFTFNDLSTNVSVAYKFF